MSAALSCAACRAALPEYAAGTVAPALHAQVTAHLATCAACRSEAAQWDAITAAARQEQPGDIPPPLALARVMAGVRAQLPPAQRATLSQKGTLAMQPSAERSAADHTLVTIMRPPRRRASIISSLAAVALIAVVAQLLFARLHAPASEGGPARSISAAELRTLNLRAVSFATPDDGWAAGNTIPDPHYSAAQTHTPYVQPVLLHYHQGMWSRSTAIIGTSNNFVISGMQMVSLNEGWAVGHTQLPPNTDGFIEGAILHYQQGVWRKELSFPSHALTGIAMLSDHEGWAVGDRIVLHFDGYHWNPVNDPAFADIAFSATAEGSATNVWLAGTYFGGLPGNDGAAPEKVLHFDGKSWQAVEYSFNQVRINALAVASPDLAGAVGWGPGVPNRYDQSLPKSNELGVTFIFNTSAHNIIASQTPIVGLQHSIGYSDITFDTPTDGYIIGAGGLIIHLQLPSPDVENAEEVKSPTQHDLYAIAMLSPTDGWIVGDAGTILHFTHGMWQQLIPPR